MPTAQEIASLRLFFKKGVVFVAPFLVYAALIVALDPFNYFGFSHLIERDYKVKTAGKLHYTLWKTLAFLEDPAPNVVFGDSRAALIDPEKAEALTGGRWFNFAYGGGTIPELEDTFFWATEHARLERVVIGLGLLNVNKSQSKNRVTEAKAILANPLLYVTNRLVAKAAIYATISQLRGEAVAVERPPMSRDAFWRYQLGEATAAHYRQFRYSTEYIERLREIADYCHEHGIELTFLIPPSHVDLQAKIEEFGLEAENQRLRDDLRSMGRVVDFDYPNDFTRDRENFSDPFHFHPTPMILRQILSESPDPALARSSPGAAGGG